MLLVEREDVDAECEADAIDPLAVGEAVAPVAAREREGGEAGEAAIARLVLGVVKLVEGNAEQSNV